MKYNCLSEFLPLNVKIRKSLFLGTRNGDTVSSLVTNLKSHHLTIMYKLLGLYMNEGFQLDSTHHTH